ncbi:NFX1-type zinc finger-containing protein 1 [Dacryopinax primogenitus]|uniref:NFX1-type zinc finger-containing protein 1 n=1 Tax=Dacryopinax primogenitus (strain DJM 731) TaxID=1858805 RepID=M5FSK9_DACPD|nr:NFX1-type zinc finger-containing protein 1 [Dacryopinax primogenitus]EJU00451.1 NFX1-type zinc finger-containing protein 1 [Dacryopinax primogenitus]
MPYLLDLYLVTSPVLPPVIMADDDIRLAKLKEYFDAVLAGKHSLNRRSVPLFLEGLYHHPDPVSCVHKLISNAKRLSLLQQAVFSDISSPVLQMHITSLILYLRHPSLKDLADGDYLQRIVRHLTEPPILLDALEREYRSDRLADDSLLALGWLTLQLISLPDAHAHDYRRVVTSNGILDALISSPREDTRSIGYRLKHFVETCSVGADPDLENGPGGRHDNDHVNFREIAILPTTDEIHCKTPVFLRTAVEVEDIPTDQRLQTHLDNQFRLLREDMLSELRPELDIATGNKKGQHRGLVVEGLRLTGIYAKALEPKEKGRHDKWGIILECPKNYDFWFFKKDRPKKREEYLLEEGNKRFIKDMSTAGLIVDDRVVAFPTIRRITSLLAAKPPSFVLQIEEEDAFIRTWMSFQKARNIKLIQVDTPVFSYEPVLKALQRIEHSPLLSELICWDPGYAVQDPAMSPKLLSIVEKVRRNPAQDLASLTGSSKPLVLDSAQANALLSGLTRSVSIIQGPPGTGKSFIGALLAKLFHDNTNSKILVCCYTNHALDQFLEDLLDIGILASGIVRLGGKSTLRTEPLSLYNQRALGPRFRHSDWTEINGYHRQSSAAAARLNRSFLAGSLVTHKNLMTHIEFDDPDFYEALSFENEDNMQTVGKNGQRIAPNYLLSRWLKGQDAGALRELPCVLASSRIWVMPLEQRIAKRTQWETAVLNQYARKLFQEGRRFNISQGNLERKFASGERSTLCSKRIVGCTTTYAAKYKEDIAAVKPDLVLVEEAGELLESHVLTALVSTTNRLILIGDHKQLRPKVDSHDLTVEKGRGYDLNRSLFERLVMKGFRHDTLSKQHRMRPEISAYVRRLTYPELVDGDGTHNRPDIRGLRDNIIFFAHSSPEDEDAGSNDMEQGHKSSKQNEFEVAMVLKILRYLGQQGYGTDEIAILTPYLGQLHRLRETLQKDNDPVLNDLDTFDLVRAGLLSAHAASITKKRIRLATIDNYQGEESSIVIASLVRGNATRDIGFMSSPERVNVLMSRARNGLIIIGNLDTFSDPRTGGGTWVPLLSMLKEDGHIYDGLPVKCERHPAHTALLATPAQFEEECPDGGCKSPCSETLACGLHLCPSKCHQLFDHSKMKCERVLDDKCTNGHRRTWKCYENPPPTCRACDDATAIAEKKKEKAFEAQKKREQKQREYEVKRAEIQAEIDNKREFQAELELERQRTKVLTQLEKDRDNTSSRTEGVISSAFEPTPPALVPSSEHGHSSSGVITPDESPLAQRPPSLSEEDEWQRQKALEGADNASIDEIMKMVGLKEVKAQILRIKDKIVVSIRQGTSMKDERFHVVFLGNPGTGKTTVARLYAKFLTTEGVISGSEFFETSASRLASDGILSFQKALESILNAGGGAVFIDEAYQLASSSSQGSSILNFLLTEMENHHDKLVFIFAGYNREMEKFFEHNPGLNSRIPYRLSFQDYSDKELLAMLEQSIVKKYDGRMKIEGGMHGLYARICVRRLGRARGRDGFGNARALQGIVTFISERQAMRLKVERRAGLSPDDFLLTKDDMIGPDPSKVLEENVTWKELMSLIGLDAVKQAVRNLFNLVESNYRRDLKEKEPLAMSLNCVFLGNPGTGKTTVANLYGQILADLGLLSRGEVVLKNPSDFIGSVLGESESKTKTILASTVGKVLVIDEAYMLHGGSASNSTSDPYKTSVIDTLVAEVQSVPGEDRCVIMCGYEAQMVKMFQEVNPGLSRRFQIEKPFRFEDFTDSQLLEILNSKLKRQDLDATPEAKAVAIGLLNRARNRPNFGNAGEVDNLLSKAKERAQPRGLTDDVIFQPEDFDPDFGRVARSNDALEQLFAGDVGHEMIVEKLRAYQNIATRMQKRRQGINELRRLIPTNFVFKGPPGTGKTTTARKMGMFYYNMGFLNTPEVVECSASDLVGEYIGHTGPKTEGVFSRARGKVLFIDEAYRLAHGPFAKEAVDEMVDLLTKEEYVGRLVVVLAGYEDQMNQLLSVNPGLSSRFPEEIHFHNLPPVACLRILFHELKKQGVSCPHFPSPESQGHEELIFLFEELSRLPTWGNARDVKELAKRMERQAFDRASESPDLDLHLSIEDAIACVTKLAEERVARDSMTTRIDPVPGHGATLQLSTPSLPLPSPSISRVKTLLTVPSDEAVLKTARGEDDLQTDDQKNREVQEKADVLIRQLESEVKSADDAQTAAEKDHEELARKIETNADDQNASRLLEQQRIDKIRAAADAELGRRALEAEKERQRKAQREEARMQQKLRDMGVCVAGFRWIKQVDGYRCAGGSHWVSSQDLRD